VSNLSYIPGEYKVLGKTGAAHWGDLADTQNVTFSALYGNPKFSLGLNAFANRAGNHFLFKDYYKITRRKINNEVFDVGGGVNFLTTLPDNWTKLAIKTDIYYGDLYVPGGGTSTNFGEQKETSVRSAVTLDAPHVSEKIATEASVSYNVSRTNFNDATSDSEHNLQNIIAINRWSFYHLKNITFRAGADYSYNNINSSNIGLHDRHDTGIYLTTEIKAKKIFMTTISAKLVSDGNSIVPIPKLGFIFNINESFAIKNNYFRSFKFPDFEDLYWGGGGLSGNPNLKPEDGWGGDLIFEYNYKTAKNYKLNTRSTFFAQWTADSIHWYSLSGGAWAPQNVGEAAFFGLDAQIGFDIPLQLGAIQSINLSASYQGLLSYMLSYGYTWESKKRIPYMPMHTIGGSVEIPWKLKNRRTGSLLLSAHYESKRYANTSNYTKLKPYTLLNATINQEFYKDLFVFAAFRNILNVDYQSMDTYPMPGFSFTLGIKGNIEFKAKKETT
jgi:vitamin B12 transporter